MPEYRWIRLKSVHLRNCVCEINFSHDLFNIIHHVLLWIIAC